MCSVAARAAVVQATSVLTALSTSSSRARACEGEEWREEVRRWRQERAAVVVPNGLSCGAYLSAGRLMASGSVLRHRVQFGVNEPPLGGRRGEVRPWSKASRRRLREALHRVNWSRHSSAWVVVTLTLPGNDVEMCRDGRVTRRWRRAFVKRWWRSFGPGVYAWKQEFQGRGAVHFAVVMPCPSNALAQPSAQLAELRRWVGRAWFEVVGSGSTAHLRAGTNVELIRDVRRLSTYIVGEVVKGRKSKEYQHVVPGDFVHVGRWWGVSRGLCEPWSAPWVQSERHAYAVRRVLTRSVTSRIHRRIVERQRRKRVSSMTVFVKGDAQSFAWRLQELRL